MSLATLNTLDQAAFTAAIGHVFEHTPEIAAATWAQRPFASLEALHQALCATMYALPPEQQLTLIRAHPDLVGRAALAGSLGPESTAEQASAGLNRLAPEEVTEFQRLNAAYWERFNFPFVICVRENKKAGILAGFQARLGNSSTQEISTALGEIAKIAWLRLADTVEN
jgi:OHCU decarboxylase